MRELLKGLCDSYGFNLKDLVNGETILKAQPQTTGTDGRGQFFAPARGYAVYALK